MYLRNLVRPKLGKNRGRTIPKTVPKTGAKMPKTGEKPGGSLNPLIPPALAALRARARSAFRGRSYFCLSRPYNVHARLRSNPPLLAALLAPDAPRRL